MQSSVTDHTWRMPALPRHWWLAVALLAQIAQPVQCQWTSGGAGSGAGRSNFISIKIIVIIKCTHRMHMQCSRSLFQQWHARLKITMTLDYVTRLKQRVKYLNLTRRTLPMALLWSTVNFRCIQLQGGGDRGGGGCGWFINYCTALLN